MRSEEIDGGILEHWSPGEVSQAFAKNEIVVIDVRSPPEYMAAAIEGALLAPIKTLLPDKLPTQDGKPIVFYCGAGGRSRRAAEMSLQNGAARIAHMEGGFGAWKKNGLPYIGTEMAPEAAPEAPKGTPDAEE